MAYYSANTIKKQLKLQAIPNLRKKNTSAASQPQLIDTEPRPSDSALNSTPKIYKILHHLDQLDTDWPGGLEVNPDCVCGLVGSTNRHGTSTIGFSAQFYPENI